MKKLRLTLKNREIELKWFYSEKNKSCKHMCHNFWHPWSLWGKKLTEASPDVSYINYPLFKLTEVNRNIHAVIQDFLLNWIQISGDI